MVRKQEKPHHFLSIYIPEWTVHSLLWGRFTKILLCVLDNPTIKSIGDAFRREQGSYVDWFPRAAITKYHTPGGLNPQKRILSVLEARSLKSR